MLCLTFTLIKTKGKTNRPLSFNDFLKYSNSSIGVLCWVPDYENLYFKRKTKLRCSLSAGQTLLVIGKFKNRSAKRTCVGFDLLLFHSVRVLVLNISIGELKYYQ